MGQATASSCANAVVLLMQRCTNAFIISIQLSCQAGRLVPACAASCSTVRLMPAPCALHNSCCGLSLLYQFQASLAR